MRLKIAATALLVLATCKINDRSINKFHLDGITEKPAMADVMPSPKPVAHELQKDTAEPKTQPAKPETEKIVLPIHIEKRLGEGFKKTPFFTGRYADSALWLDGKGNAIITHENGTRIKEMGEITSQTKGAITIKGEDGRQITYYPNGLVGSDQLIINGPRHSK